MLSVARFVVFRNRNPPPLHLSSAFRSYQGKSRTPVGGKRYNKVPGFYQKDPGLSLTRFREQDFLTDDTEEDLYHEDGPRIENPEFIKDEMRKEEKRLKNVTRKTIERKYFKPPQEVNLLTWDAKEQIRYLHQEFPQEWTVERLAESFPISKEGVKKLLKSKFVERSEKEILKHDRTVQQLWKAIEADTPQGPISHRNTNLKFAAGNKALPSPRTRSIEGSSERMKSNSKPGQYASIVKDYVERKEKAKVSEQQQQLKVTDKPGVYLTVKTPAENQKKRRTGSDNDTIPQTSAVTLHNSNKTPSTHPVKSSHTSSPLSERINYRSLFKYKSARETEDMKQEAHTYTGSLLDAIQESQKKSEMSSSPSREQMRAREYKNRTELLPEFDWSHSKYNSVQHEESTVDNMRQQVLPSRTDAEDYGDLDLVKLDSSRIVRDQDSKPYLHNMAQQKLPSRRCADNYEDLDIVKLDSLSTARDQDNKPYLHNIAQHDLPSMRSVEDYEYLDMVKLNSSKIMKDKDNNAYLYRRDNNYYDEDGEFLFKT